MKATIRPARIVQPTFKSTRSRRSLRRVALLSAAAISLAHSAQLSAQLYWDRNDVASGAGATPTGSWDGSSLNWNSSSDGTGTLGAWQADNAAVFSAGTDATGDADDVDAAL